MVVFWKKALQTCQRERFLPNSERTPHSAHTRRDNPTLPLFIRTPLGAMKMPLPTTVPMMKDTAGSRPISLRRHTASSAFFSFRLSSSFFSCISLQFGGSGRTGGKQVWPPYPSFPCLFFSPLCPPAQPPGNKASTLPTSACNHCSLESRHFPEKVALAHVLYVDSAEGFEA